MQSEMKKMDVKTVISHSLFFFVVAVSIVGSWRISGASAENKRHEIVDSHGRIKIPAQMNRGWIDAVKGDEIVIDDLTYPVASMKIYDEKGFSKGKTSLIVGQHVAFTKEGKGGTVVYLLSGKGNRPQKIDASIVPAAPVSKDKKNPIRRVNGVWKN
jgi:hypothetical protein